MQRRIQVLGGGYGWWVWLRGGAVGFWPDTKSGGGGGGGGGVLSVSGLIRKAGGGGCGMIAYQGARDIVQ